MMKKNISLYMFLSLFSFSPIYGQLPDDPDDKEKARKACEETGGVFEISEDNVWRCTPPKPTKEQGEKDCEAAGGKFIDIGPEGWGCQSGG